MLRPAARPRGDGARGGQQRRPVAAGSRGHRRQELGGSEGRGRHRAPPALSPMRWLLSLLGGPARNAMDREGDGEVGGGGV
jgi:hypothetical protein